jgi:23S rRNA pseudouridine1911/1915/1917 synthase
MIVAVTFICDRHERLDKFLASVLPEHSRTKLARLANEGKVLVDGKEQRSSYELSAGSRVELAEPQDQFAHDLTPADIALDVRYEDEHLLVVNKPRGLAVHPAASLKEPSLVNALLSRRHGLSTAGGDFRPGIVHRLDKDTTGLLIVAKTDSAHAKLAKQIELKSAARRYAVVVAGNVDHEAFTIQAPIGRNRHNRVKMSVDPGGKAAVTHFRTIAHLPAGTLLVARLETGRTHQIRVHLQSMGHPVLGDRLYAPKHYQTLPLQLHAAFLRFQHPVTTKTIEVFAEPPSDFEGHERVTIEELAREV